MISRECVNQVQDQREIRFSCWDDLYIRHGLYGVYPSSATPRRRVTVIARARKRRSSRLLGQRVLSEN